MNVENRLCPCAKKKLIKFMYTSAENQESVYSEFSFWRDLCGFLLCYPRLEIFKLVKFSWLWTILSLPVTVYYGKQEALWAALIRAETVDTCHQKIFDNGKLFRKTSVCGVKSRRKIKYLNEFYLMLVFEVQMPIWAIKSRNQVNSLNESLMVFARISHTLNQLWLNSKSSDTENKVFLLKTMGLTT